MAHSHTTNSPLGPLTLQASDEAITSLTIADRHSVVEERTPQNPLLAAAVSQLSEYFQGTRTEFELPVAFSGTPFQEKIWSALRTIPYGQSLGYEELGLVAGVGRAPRAVGGAVGANPVPIIIPCHRVLSSTKAITGYSGGAGIPTKVALLELEGITYRSTSTTKSMTPSP
jgi:methylated-DNA-[protein]-cysteine S-methyltransferase